MNSVQDERFLKKPVLKINNLVVTFSRKHGGVFNRRSSIVHAVDNVSFQIYESETVSLVGESGSGKTTIARCILGLTTPTSGSIKYNDVEVSGLKGKQLINYRREVQFIFQDPFESLNPRQDVITIVSIPVMRLNGEKDRRRVTEITTRLLSEVGLDPNEVITKFPHQLSGGQRQKVNIARALASNPKVLIADEPITMLDASQRLNILSLLMRLKQNRNLTIFLITHDLASAKLTSDRTFVMYVGKLFEFGPTRGLLSRPHHPYTELILSATPRLKEEIGVLGEKLGSIDESLDIGCGCIFAPRCKYVTDVCRKIEPPLEEKSEAHFAACHNALNLF